MLSKIQKSKGLLSPVPRTWERYWVNTDGMLLEKISVDGYRRIVGDAYGWVVLHISNETQRVNIKNLIQLTFKSVYEEDFDFYLHANVDTIDGSLNNFIPTNLIWNFGISHYGNGFYRIPGYSRFLINKEGKVFNRVKEYFPPINYSERDYVLVYAYPDYRYDNTNSNAMVHRLLALAFIQYDNTVTKLDVNHIDGNKHNFNLDNLEWLTRLENIQHAMSNGLSTDARGVRVTNILTNKIIDYSSQAECATDMNICKKLLSWRIRYGKDKIYDSIYRFESLATAPVIKHRSSPKSVIIQNTETKETFEAASIAKAAKFIGISNAALKKRFSRNALKFDKWQLYVYSPSQGESKPDI